MPNKQLVVVDPNTDKVYELGPWGQMHLEALYPDGRARRIFQNQDDTDHYDRSLTPLPNNHIEVLYRKLGKAIYKSVPEQYQGRITGEYRKTPRGQQELGCFADGNIRDIGVASIYCHVILTPAPPPVTHTVRFDNDEPITLSDESFQNLKQGLK